MTQEWTGAGLIFQSKKRKNGLIHFRELFVVFEGKTGDVLCDKVDNFIADVMEGRMIIKELDENPHEWIYKGISRFNYVFSDDIDDKPIDGAEISFSDFTFGKEEEFNKYCKGEPLWVLRWW